MTNKEFCAWVRLQSAATATDIAVMQRLLEATDRLAEAADEIERLQSIIDHYARQAAGKEASHD